ncbi:hypothetical protein [Bdellovibrio sp. KM01]|uniref:hypothetical protein n=1 Tax=Bdellovibrio sp. KM01 TaxID=2748865 RepID=UPI0015EA4B98|nr:hypothetical protein [Bdellovibrio sp. KM01]QLY24415.1 hypothetical protein HW988_13225 [Bdellovibrio sp. KM01]
MNKILIIAACLAAQGAYAADSRDFDANGLTKVSVENYNGEVTINAADGSKSIVTITKNTMPDMCKVNAERSGTKLSIEVKRKGKADCQVDMDIKVPKMVKLDLEVGTGKVAIKGTQGHLSFKMGAGSFIADGSFDSVDGKTGAATTVIKGITGDTEFKTGSGNVTLQYSSLPQKGKLEFKNGSGNSTLLLPKGSQINAKLTAYTGHMENEFGSNKDAQFSVEAKSGSGDLKVKSY